MANGNDLVSDELWEEFHRVVNMTSRELSDWLMVRGASEKPRHHPTRRAPEQVRRLSTSWASGGPT